MALDFGGNFGLIPKTTDNILLDFQDNIAGRSIVLYYGVAMTTSAGVTRALVRDAGTSYPTTTTGAGAHNFDIIINKQTTFSGLSYLDMSLQHSIGHTVTFQLFHWDGASETAISDLVTAPSGAGTTRAYKFPFTISIKIFSPGTYLRLKATLVATNAITNGFKLWMPVVILE